MLLGAARAGSVRIWDGEGHVAGRDARQALIIVAGDHIVRARCPESALPRRRGVQP
jgi:hypothetical protein